MELSHKAAVALAKSLRPSLNSMDAASDVVICPSYPSLQAVAEIFPADSRAGVGAQDVEAEEKGALTGQVSVTQISSFVQWCIVGHSERRQILGEDDEQVAHKADVLLRHGITPIICLGETAAERQADETIAKITRQVQTLVATLPRTSLVRAAIAYEPIWAIGTGETPEPDGVAEINLLIRKMLAERFDAQLSERVRIIYGGSVKPENVGSYVGGPYADGVLVGGASVHAGQFLEIIQRVQERF